MRSPLFPPPARDYSKDNALSGQSVATEPLPVPTGVILAYALLQVLVIFGWIAGGLYLLELLTPLPGGWLLAIAIILGGIGASPNIAQLLLMAADRRIQLMIARAQFREAEEETVTTTKTDLQYRLGKSK